MVVQHKRRPENTAKVGLDMRKLEPKISDVAGQTQNCNLTYINILLAERQK